MSAYDEGYQDYCDGKKSSQNRYGGDRPRKRKNWFLGWNAADKDDFYPDGNF